MTIRILQDIHSRDRHLARNQCLRVPDEISADHAKHLLEERWAQRVPDAPPPAAPGELPLPAVETAQAAPATEPAAAPRARARRTLSVASLTGTAPK